MKYDYKTLYEKNAAFYNARPKAKKALLIGNLALTLAFTLAYGALLVYAFLSPDKFETKPLVKLLFAPMLCVFLVAVLRLAFNRPRPYSETGANVTPLLQKRGAQDKSFPSRHLSCAFVIVGAFLAHFTLIGVGLLGLACALGYIRFALGLHYPSDLVGGAIVGLFCSLFLFI
jgi:undecaprenyl-diphosphatase